jgi:UDP-glucose 4-epimerase
MAAVKSILITGGNGYIAKSLYKAFEGKYEVTSVCRADFDLVNSEATNVFFRDKSYDVVVHTAVSGGSRLKQDDWSTLDNNLLMYYNLYSNKDKFKRLIHFGSGAELLMKEEPYGYSKDVIRKSILNNTNFYNLRIFGVFDENELDSRFIKANIKRYINRESIVIHQDKQMDFIYMPDLIKVVEYYISSDGPKELNCNYDSITRLSDIAAIINNLNDYKVNIETVSRELGSIYASGHTDIGVQFAGLCDGIKEVYNKLKK